MGGGYRDIKQSFVLAISRVRLSLYEQRILIKMVEHGQQRLKGLWLRENLKKLPHDYDNVRIAFPIRYILSDGSQHYEQIEAAARSLCTRRFEFEDDERKVWYCSSLIHGVQWKKRSGIISFYVDRVFFDVLFDFSRGYCQYDLQQVLALPSPYAVRFYILMNQQNAPISFNVPFLKNMFGVSDKYAQTADFIKKVVEPARKALDDAGCNSFTFTRLKSGNKVTSLTFTPVKRQPLSQAQMQAQLAVSSILSTDIRNILTVECGFTIKELNAHKDLWMKLAQNACAIDILDNIVERARRLRKQKGYIVNAIKSELGVPRKRNNSTAKNESN